VGGDLADLEFSDVSAAGDVIQDEGRETSPRPIEASGKEITDRQEQVSQGEKLALQEFLGSVAREPTGATFRGGAAPPGATPDPRPGVRVQPTTPSSGIRKQLLAYAPLLSACALFLLWVVYDHSRKPPIDRTLAQAVAAYEKGEVDVALDLVDRALQENPDSELARSLAKLFAGIR
jgi:hypothetical protein